METLTLGTAIGLNMTHNASFYAESTNAAAWKTERGWLKLSFECTHEINPTGKFPKRPWEESTVH